MEMIYVAPGSFMMGSPESKNGGPYAIEVQHRVTLKNGFWLGKYAVTQAQWQSVMGTNPSAWKGDMLPVENVSWEDCHVFIKKVNTQLNCGARLPTEAEWEYACRAGKTSDYGGIGNLDEMGWYRDNSGAQTHKVGQKLPNDWGFHDMHGNVWEWCEDWYGDYPVGEVIDPTGIDSGCYRIARGGSWSNSSLECRSAYRRCNGVDDRDRHFGFRLACHEGAFA